ncbi:hypothetical protein CERSUDRAFT_97495 [Gelatoporia subvermispora B]|uniref:Uncharacterized protein n=1 Tax=Ceriporiopsis subvermispora (strain B) TaxID=914234 RepID=M2R5Q1_CERS8|nr:hypothetical protein CERSUDRAFT_97495 [Gelatoporia subvermispora B]
MRTTWGGTERALRGGQRESRTGWWERGAASGAPGCSGGRGHGSCGQGATGVCTTTGPGAIRRRAVLIGEDEARQGAPLRLRDTGRSMGRSTLGRRRHRRTRRHERGTDDENAAADWARPGVLPKINAVRFAPCARFVCSIGFGARDRSWVPPGARRPAPGPELSGRGLILADGVAASELSPEPT